jgi:DNA damage-binding protein 1
MLSYDAAGDAVPCVGEQLTLSVATAAGEIVTRAKGDASSRYGRPVNGEKLGSIDPDGRCIALHLYEGSLKIVPLDVATGVAGEAFDVRCPSVFFG